MKLCVIHYIMIQIRANVYLMSKGSYSATQSGDYVDNPRKQSKAKEYENQIDQMVYKLYG